MPQIPKHLKIKRAQKCVLVKKRHFLKNFPVVKSCKLLCKQLRSNNNSLAKALSKEKQECQMLFSENIDLSAMVQDLGSACNKRDAVISNILKDAKEMLKMIVTMSSYLTNTISCCQEFAKATNTNMSYSSAGRRESTRRLSMKSPTRGVVKPMVSGHTITKPTINLSRLNMQNINNSSNLSIIPEVTTPPRNEDPNNSVPMRSRRYTNGRKCRMPERLNITRNSDENERRSNERSRRHTEKLSGRLSKSRSSMNNSSRRSIETFENIGSPRVQLNDVSKLLQNSQTINIRMLEENQNNVDTNSGLDDTVNLDLPHSNNIISETPPSNGSPDKDDSDVCNENQTSNNTMDEQGRKSTKENLSSDWDDPLEGPSWLFNNPQVVPSTSKEQKTDNVNDSNDGDISMTLNGVESDKESSDDEETIKHAFSLSALINENGLDSTEEEKNENDENDETGENDENDENHENNENNENTSSQLDNNNLPNMIEEMAGNNQIENGLTVMDRANFVTQRRGCLESEDEDDFTLILPALKPRNVHFDMNDLKLPVFEQSSLKPESSAEPEPEITGRIPLQKISQIFPMPSVSHNSLNESTFDQSTVKLPTLENNDYDEKLLPSKEEPRKQKKETNKESNHSDCIYTTSRSKSKNKQKKKKDKIVKDPSSAKVVLEKLNESDVKLGTPSLNKSSYGDSNQSLNSASSRADISSDSDSNASSFSLHVPTRPKRARAPLTLHEPNLRKKLRRNE